MNEYCRSSRLCGLGYCGENELGLETMKNSVMEMDMWRGIYVRRVERSEDVSEV
jgi:hypothetical protein